MQTMLTIVPLSFRQACQFIYQHHRHHKPPQGHKCSLGVMMESQIVGIAVVGRPVARHLDDGKTLEVTRLCTTGYQNACSKLYAASWRAGRAMGYTRMITYVLENETGISVKAAGWICEGLAGGGNWNKPGRPREDSRNSGVKRRYVIAVP